MRVLALVTTLLLLVAGVTAPLAASSAASSQRTSYRGAHVSFETTPTALTDYRVDGHPFIDSLAIESRSAVRNDSPVPPSLSNLSSLNGSPLNVTSKSRTRVRMRTGDGGVVTAHDDGHGVLLVKGRNRTQYVRATLPTGSDAVFENNSQVVATTANGSEATFSVIGNGTIDVDDAGNVVAELGNEGLLVVRTYRGKRSAAEQKREQLIVDGVATGEVYVMPRANGTAVDTISYEPETSLNVTDHTRDSIRFRLDRRQRQGVVVLTNFEDSNVTNASDVAVSVDGTAAKPTEQYGKLASSANNGRISRYLVTTANGSGTGNGSSGGSASTNGSTTNLSAPSASSNGTTFANTSSLNGSSAANTSAANTSPSNTSVGVPHVAEVDLSVTHFSGHAHTVVVRPASQQQNESAATNASRSSITTTTGTSSTPVNGSNGTNGSNATDGSNGSRSGVTGTFNPGFGLLAGVVTLFVVVAVLALAFARRRR